MIEGPDVMETGWSSMYMGRYDQVIVDKLPENTRMVGQLNNRSNERYVNEQEGIGKAVKRVGQSIGVSGEGICHGEMYHVCSVPTFMVF